MNIKDLLRKRKINRYNSPGKSVRMKITYTRPLIKTSGRPVRVIAINRRKLRYVALGLVVIFTIGFGIYSFKFKDAAKDADKPKDSNIADTSVKEDLPIPEEEPEEVELPIIDLSGHNMPLETSLQRINEPIPYGREILYSAGNSENIDEPVFQDLYLMNMDSGEEKVIAHTEIKFGEIYEGRFNQDWITWLDTNQSGENQLYVMDRKTGEISKIKTCEFNKPQLRLAGDNLVWVEQRDVEQDSLYLYNFKSGEPVVLEVFNNPTYGTCPPSISNDTLVWVAPNEEDPDNFSIIKKLDLSIALSTDLGNSAQGEEETEEGTALGDNSSQPRDEGVDPEIINPQGFAIYPVTNGKAIAWLDNLNPSDANLKLTLDNGNTIIDVAHNVARPYGIGNEFIAYMKDDTVMVYFWELDRYAKLNKPGTKARLTQGGVSGNTVVWYSADNPNQKKDDLIVSIVDKPTEEQLLGSN